MSLSWTIVLYFARVVVIAKAWEKHSCLLFLMLLHLKLWSCTAWRPHYEANADNNRAGQGRGWGFWLELYLVCAVYLPLSPCLSTWRLLACLPACLLQQLPTCPFSEGFVKGQKCDAGSACSQWRQSGVCLLWIPRSSDPRLLPFSPGARPVSGMLDGCGACCFPGLYLHHMGVTDVSASENTIPHS